MNVIFEGISGVGKTTLIGKLVNKFDKDETIVIGDLEYETPIKAVLTNMVKEAPLMQNKVDFKTSLYESLLLAANHHFIQEKLRNTNKICLYDRDFLTILVYQKYIIQQEYNNWKEIFEVYKKLVLLNLKTIDVLVYINLPLKTAVENTERRDNRKFTAEDIKLLELFKEEYKKYLEKLKNKIFILELNGLNDISKNVNIVYDAIQKVKKL